LYKPFSLYQQGDIQGSGCLQHLEPLPFLASLFVCGAVSRWVSYSCLPCARRYLAVPSRCGFRRIPFASRSVFNDYLWIWYYRI